jgi:hypothetical protein
MLEIFISLTERLELNYVFLLFLFPVDSLENLYCTPDNYLFRRKQIIVRYVDENKLVVLKKQFH